MYETTLEADVEATMRDGVVLRADVYRPDVDGKFPVILERTPYNKGADRFHEKGAKLAERGFLYVIQDVRGRYESDGEFMPGFFSGDHKDDVDGYDTVEWAASLPWSTGKVGTTGGSYDGWTQLELSPHEAAAPQGDHAAADLRQPPRQRDERRAAIGTRPVVEHEHPRARSARSGQRPHRSARSRRGGRVFRKSGSR